MDFRVTSQVTYDLAVAYARQHSDLLAHLQQEAATGNRLLRPSDDPLATVQLLSNQAQNLRLDTYQSNVQAAQATLNGSNSALLEVGNIFTQAQQVASEGSNSTNDPTSFEALATQVDALINRLLDAANTKQGDQYAFAGTAVNTKPFTVLTTDSQGRPESVGYQGAFDSAQVIVGPQQTVATRYVGSQIFQQRQRGATIYTGSTGAAAGTGTDSATGEGTLLVSHTSTTYAPGSGIQPGTGSAAGDTIIGPAGAHNITVIDTSGVGASGTVSLDGGAPVAFTNADANLKVTGPNGAVVFVDTTAITPNFNGSVAITANGTLSVDGGASSIPINFSGNQVVTNSTTGAVTNVNSTNIRTTGTDDLNYTGTYDAFQILIALRDDLRNTRGLTAAQQVQSISQRLSELDRVHQGILQVVGQQSANLQNLDALQNRMKSVQLDTQKRITDLQGADISQVVIGLQEQLNLLQLTLASSSRILSVSLLDFLH